MNERVLGVFAKQPIPGRVKTRLALATSPEWAARMSEACLRDTLHRCATIAARRVVLFDPPEAAAWFAEVAGPCYELKAQCPGELGARFATFFHDNLAAGGQRVIALGADSPTLPIEFVEQAFDALAAVDVVFGPALDGGYYLVGCSTWVPELFQDVPWSTRDVLATSLERCKAAARQAALLPPWYDVDTLADWEFLQGHLLALRDLGRAMEQPFLSASFE